jgi:formate hydrogenlyase subunit 4
VDVVASVVVVVSLPPCPRKGVASTATFGKVVVAVAIAITIAVIAVVMNTFLYSFQMNLSIKYIKEYSLKNRRLLRNLLKLDVFWLAEQNG